MCSKPQVPLLLASSSTSLTESDLEHWLDGVLASDTQLSQHIAERQVISVAAPASTDANRSLEQGLLWLAARAPNQPRLKVGIVARHSLAHSLHCWVIFGSC